MAKKISFNDYLKTELKDPKFKKDFERGLAADDAAVALYNLRHELGYTQAELAQKSGRAKSTIVRIENGNMNPRLETLQQIASSVGKHVQLKFV
ncbi:MAG TPA: XRE family transcriptional regulator [Lactobacillus sp.]|nr:XRE family transcriptional regulator [Lactobacillus sp.]